MNMKELLSPLWKPFYLAASETYSLCFSSLLLLSWFTWQQGLWFLGVHLPLFFVLSPNPLSGETMWDNEVRTEQPLEQMNSEKQRPPFHANVHSHLTGRKKRNQGTDIPRSGCYSRVFHGALTSLSVRQLSKPLSLFQGKWIPSPCGWETRRNTKSSLNCRAWLYIHTSSPLDVTCGLVTHPWAIRTYPCVPTYCPSCPLCLGGWLCFSRLSFLCPSRC